VDPVAHRKITVKNSLKQSIETKLVRDFRSIYVVDILEECDLTNLLWENVNLGINDLWFIFVYLNDLSEYFYKNNNKYILDAQF